MVPAFSAKVTGAELGAALRDRGCAVVRGAFDDAVRARLAGEFEPHIGGADPEAGRLMNAAYEAEGGLGYKDFGWVRQEENHYLEIPVGEALELDASTRDLIGYKMHAGLGFSEAYL